MSGWDAPTGSWDKREEPEEPNGPGEQGHQQDQSTAGHRAPRGSEGPLRAGRRGLPGYDQAEAYDQAAGYDSGSGYGGVSGYGPGPGYGQQSVYEPVTGSGQQPSLGSGPQAPGPPANTPSSGPRRAIAPGPLRPQAALGPGPSAAAGYDESRTGPFPGYGSAEGNPPSWSDTSDQQGYLSPQSYTAQQGSGGQPGSGADRDYGADQDYQTQRGARPGYGLEGSGGEPGYAPQAPAQGGFLPAGVGHTDQPRPDQNYQAQVYPQQGFERSDYPQSDGNPQSGYPPQSDYPQSDYPQSGFPQSDYPQNGFGRRGAWPDESIQDAADATRPGSELPSPLQGGPGSGARDSYGQQATGPGGFLPGGTGAAEQSYPATDYQADAYKLPDSEPSGFGQNGFDPNGFGQNGFDPNGASHDVGQDVPAQDSYSQGAYTQDGYAPAGYDPAGYDQDGYSQAGYAPGAFGQPAGPSGSPEAGYSQEAYGQGGYGQDSYPQPGFEPLGGHPYGDDDFASHGRPPRSGLTGPGRPGPDRGSPHRLGNIRMILYLAASVIGVVLIVLLVLHLTKSGGKSPASGSSTPTARATATAGGAASRYALTQAADVGTYPLNTTATKEFGTIAVNKATPSAAQIKAKGAGQPGASVVGIYTIGPVTSVASSDFRGILFVGYNGTFDPAAVIKVVQSELVSSSVASAGPHGGNMVCGYNTSTGTDASECVWVTPTTLGEVQYLEGAYPAKYPAAATLALDVRNALEVHAG